MINRAPRVPVDFGRDSAYIHSALRNFEQTFGVNPFPGMANDRIPARTMLKQLIMWWRTSEPENAAQAEAHGRLPGAIRLIDSHCAWLEEKGVISGPGLR